MSPTPLINPTTFPAVRFANISTLVGVIVPLAYIVGGLVFGWMLIWSAYLIITAEGDKEKIQKAQQTATFAAIGILMVVVAALLVNVLGFITNIDFQFI